MLNELTSLTWFRESLNLNPCVPSSNQWILNKDILCDMLTSTMQRIKAYVRMEQHVHLRTVVSVRSSSSSSSSSSSFNLTDKKSVHWACIAEVPVKCKTVMKTLFLCFNLCLSVMLDSLSCSLYPFPFFLNIYKYLIVFYRVGDYKLIEGYAGVYNGWYPLPVNESVYNIEEPTVDYYQLYDLKS